MSYGPAGESPSRLQRAFAAAPPIVSSAAFGVAIALVMDAVFLLSRPDLYLAVLALFLPLSITGAVIFHLMRHDRRSSREERMSALVPYPRGRPHIITTQGRFWVAVGLFPICVVAVVLGVYGGLASGSAPAAIGYGAVSFVALIGFAREVVLWRRHASVNEDASAPSRQI